MTGSRSSARKSPVRVRLYVAGDSPNSTTALRNLRSLLSRYGSELAELEIVDVLETPEEGLRAGVLATPTMVKIAPPPTRRIVGNLKDTDAVLAVLGLTAADHD